MYSNYATFEEMVLAHKSIKQMELRFSLTGCSFASNAMYHICWILSFTDGKIPGKL